MESAGDDAMSPESVQDTQSLEGTTLKDLNSSQPENQEDMKGQNLSQHAENDDDSCTNKNLIPKATESPKAKDKIVWTILDVVFLSLSRGFVGALSRPEFTIFLLPVGFFVNRCNMLSSTFVILGTLCAFAMLLNIIWRNEQKIAQPVKHRTELLGELHNLPTEDAETAEWLNTAIRHVWRRYPQLIAGSERCWILIMSDEANFWLQSV